MNGRARGPSTLFLVEVLVVQLYSSHCQSFLGLPLIPLSFKQVTISPAPLLMTIPVFPLFAFYDNGLREWLSKRCLGTLFIRIWQPIKNADSWIGPRPNQSPGIILRHRRQPIRTTDLG